MIQTVKKQLLDFSPKINNQRITKKYTHKYWKCYNLIVKSTIFKTITYVSKIK